ncbi:hypothetical protein FACS1894198_1190 [Clostridia bacterium]|nr:hypothetical protein FACS1894198_1190 [Clostridia bacterium]
MNKKGQLQKISLVFLALVSIFPLFSSLSFAAPISFPQKNHFIGLFLADWREGNSLCFKNPNVTLMLEKKNEVVMSSYDSVWEENVALGFTSNFL